MNAFALLKKYDLLPCGYSMMSFSLFFVFTFVCSCFVRFCFVSYFWGTRHWLWIHISQLHMKIVLQQCLTESTTTYLLPPISSLRPSVAWYHQFHFLRHFHPFFFPSLLWARLLILTQPDEHQTLPRSTCERSYRLFYLREKCSTVSTTKQASM